MLEYGGSSAAAKRELEQLFAQRPDKPAAARLAWMHHVQTRDFRCVRFRGIVHGIDQLAGTIVRNLLTNKHNTVKINRRATADLRALADEAPALDLKVTTQS